MMIWSKSKAASLLMVACFLLLIFMTGQHGISALKCYHCEGANCPKSDDGDDSATANSIRDNCQQCGTFPSKVETIYRCIETEDDASKQCDMKATCCESDLCNSVVKTDTTSGETDHSSSEQMTTTEKTEEEQEEDNEDKVTSAAPENTPAEDNSNENDTSELPKETLTGDEREDTTSANTTTMNTTEGEEREEKIHESEVAPTPNEEAIEDNVDKESGDAKTGFLENAEQVTSSTTAMPIHTSTSTTTSTSSTSTTTTMRSAVAVNTAGTHHGVTTSSGDHHTSSSSTSENPARKAEVTKNLDDPTPKPLISNGASCPIFTASLALPIVLCLAQIF